MEDQDDITKQTCCCGCLCKNEEKQLFFYNVQNEALKTVFRVDFIWLCYLCKRRAEQAEFFIQNVQSNQILLENFHNLTDATLETIKSQVQPLTDLTEMLLHAVNLNGKNETSTEGSFFVTYNGWAQSDVKVKIEMKEEGTDLLDNLEDYVDNEDLESYVKEEDEYPLKLLKEELETEGIKIKCLRKTLKKEKCKKKKSRQSHDTNGFKDIKDIKIETIHITRDQCMEERTKMAKDKKYINSVYKCVDCVKGFTFKASYEKHMESHSESNGDYECDICKQRLHSEEKLRYHQRYHSLRYKCSVCNLTRISRLTVKDHFTAFHCNDYYHYSCPHCSKVFKRQVSMRKHIAYMHKRKQRVQCAFCTKEYSSKEALKAHLLMRHPSEVSAGKMLKRQICQECGMAFKSPSQLKNHSIKHSHSRDHYCVECDKSFKSDYILKHHLKTAMPHTKYLELPYPCLHCNKRFAIRRDVERHTNRVHLNYKPFQCDSCDKAYVNQWSLTEHRKVIHEGYKRPLKFPCPMCDKVFDRNQILKGHIRTHTGERPYQCSKCPAQFSQASILGTHVKLIHLKLTRDGRPKAVSNALK